jgi:type IV pilus assembly protein PilM
MAIPLRKRTSTGQVGLDIDGEFLAAVQTASGRVERAATAELPEGVVSDGEVKDPATLSGQLRDFFKANDLPRNVRLGISNQHIVVRRLELPRIEDASERDAAIRFQAAEAIAMPLDEAVLDHQVIGFEKTDAGERMTVVVVAARRSMVDSFVEAVRGAGLRPEGIDLDAFALVRALAPPAADGQEARLYCHLAAVANLAVAVGDSCFFTRPLMASWRVPDVDQAATALAEEVRLSIDYYLAQPGVLPVADAVLSGPGAQNEELVSALAERLVLPVSVAEPLGGLDAAGVPAGDEPHRYTVAAGLALGAAA